MAPLKYLRSRFLCDVNVTSTKLSANFEIKKWTVYPVAGHLVKIRFVKKNKRVLRSDKLYFVGCCTTLYG